LGTPRTPTSDPPKTILLVDDDPAILALFSVRLEQAGFRVLKAHTATEALSRAEQEGRIDVLATDLVLTDQLRLAKHHGARPTHHGIGLMRQLLSRQPTIKVVLFSGQSDETLKTLGPIPSGIAFLRKPFGPEALVHSIEKVLKEPAEAPSPSSHDMPSRPSRRTFTSWRVPLMWGLVTGCLVMLGLFLLLVVAANPRWQGYVPALWKAWNLAGKKMGGLEDRTNLLILGPSALLFLEANRDLNADCNGAIGWGQPWSFGSPR
jgi:CheY-like chemotaxis protein